MAHHQNANSVFYATTYHPIQAGSIDGTDTASHDNGVYRALLASSTGLYDPTGDPKAEGDPYNTLFIGRLAHHTTEKTLHETMSKYGRVKKLRLVRHIVTGASRGYAFVEFETENDMQNAYEMAHYYVIDGSQILVDYNRQQLMPGWIPRRLDYKTVTWREHPNDILRGGLGGHKESGQLRFGGRDRPFRAPLRTIPQEQLIKLGIPLPPVGRYMSRFQIPPTPRRPGSFKEGSHYRRKGSYKRSPSLETLPSNILANKELVEMEQRAELSPKAGKRPADSERGSGTHKEHTSRQTSRGDAEENFSNERYHRHEEGKEHKKRRFSEHRDEQVDERKFTRSGQEDRGSDEHHERSANRSDYKEKRSGHHERSTSKSGHKHRDSGHRHKRERETRECSRDLDRSPKHGSEESRRSRSKRRSRDDKMSDV